MVATDTLSPRAGIQREYSSAWILCALWFLLLSPSIAVVPGLPAIRVEELICVAWLSKRFFETCLGVKWHPIFYPRLKLWMLFFIALPCSIAAAALNGYPVVANDWNQLIRFLKYLCIYMMCREVLGIETRSMKATVLLDRLLFLSLPIFLVSVQQKFNWFGLNEYYVERIAPTQAVSLLNNYPYPRPVGIVGNPNENGCIGVFVLLVALFRYIETSRKGFVLFALGGLSLVLMTMSRGSMVAAAVGCVVLLGGSLLLRPERRLQAGWMLTCGVLGLAVIGIVHVATGLGDAVLWRFGRALDPGHDSSWTQRLANWSESIALIKISPLMGLGPQRGTVFAFAADNEWLQLLRQYGILGTIAFVLAMIYPVFSFFRWQSRYELLRLALALSMFFYMIPLAVFHSLVLMPLLLILFAVCDHECEGQS